MTEEKKDTAQTINGLWSQGVLLDLDIGGPTFQKKTSESEWAISGLDSNVMRPGTKLILPKASLEDLKNIEVSSREFLKHRSLKFPLSGARFVYYRTLKEVTSFLEEKRKLWEVAVNKLAANYETLKTQQIALLDEQAKIIAAARFTADKERDEWLAEQHQVHVNYYPNLSAIPQKFHYNWNVFKINAIDGVGTMSGVEQEEVLKAQDQLRKEMQQWVKEASAALHKKLGEAAVHASEMLKKQGKLNPKNLKPLFEAFEQFKAVDFTGSSDFHTKVEEMKKKFMIEKDGQVDYSSIASAVNDTDKGMKEFSELLDDLSGLAVDTIAEEAGVKSLAKVGEFRRMVEL